MTLPERIIHGRYRVIYTVDDTAGVVVSCCRDEQTAGLVYVAEWTSLSPAERESLISAASAVQSRTIPGMCTLSDTYSDENGFTAVAVAPNAHTLGQTLRMRNGPLSEAEVISQTATLLTLLTSLHVMSTPVMLRVPTLADILVSDDGSWLVLPFVTLRSLARNASPYRAPELAGTADASPASDIYAVSAIAYHASTGIAPLTTEQLALGARFISPRSIVPGLSEMWEAVVIRGMQDKPSNRYQHATEMQAALQTMAILGASAPSIEQPLPVSFTTANGEQGSSANMIPGNVPSLISAATSPASTPSLRLGCVVALAATLTVVAIMLCVVLLLVLPGSPLRSLYDGELFRSFNSAATSPTALPSVSKAIVAATPTPQPSIQASNQPITAANAASLAATGVITNTTFGPVAWAPDGAILAVATANTVSLHESSQLTVMQRFDGHVGDITTLSWSSDSRYLASGASNDSVIHVYDTKLGSEAYTLRGHEGWIRNVVFSPDGKYLASGSTDLSIRIWDLTTKRTIQTLTGHTDLIGGLVWSARGVELASAARDGTVRRWDIATGQQIQDFSYQTASSTTATDGSRYWATALLWTKDDAQLIVGATDGSVRILDAKTGTVIRTLSAHTGWITIRGLALNTDQTILYSSGLDGLLTVWDMRSGAQTAQYNEHALGIFGISLEPNGERLVSASDQEGKLLLWDMTTQKITTLRVGTGIPLELTYATKLDSQSSTEVLAISGFNGLVRLHTTNMNQSTFLSGSMSGAQSFAFMGNDQFALIDGTNGVNLYTPESTMPLPLEGLIGVPLSVACSPDGALLVVGSVDGVQLWRTDSFGTPATLQTTLQSITNIQFSADGTKMALRGGGDNPGYEIWDLTARSLLFRADEAVYRVEFLASGTMVAVLTNANTVEVRPLTTDVATKTLTAAAAEGFMQMTTLPNSDIIVAAGFAGAVHLYDIDGTDLVRLPQNDGVTVLASNPVGSEISVGHRDGTITRYAIP